MSIGNIIGTTETWIEYQKFGEKEYQVLRNCLTGIKEREFRKKQGELTKVIGESLANRLLTELFPPQAKVAKEKPQKVEAKQVVPAPEPVRKPAPIEEQPIKTDFDEPQAEPTETESLGDKISKWFKNLFK